MDVTVRVRFPAAEDFLPPYTFVRVLHEAELKTKTTPDKMPEVRPMFPNSFAEFGKGWQEVSWKHNPLLNANNMTAVYHNHLWISNLHGFGGDTPRRNYFTQENLGASETIAVENLTCGGNLLKVIGEEYVKTSAGKVDCYIIETLDHRYPIYVEWPWLITTAVKLNLQGLPAPFPQGRQPNGYQPGVKHPLVTNHAYITAIEKWRCVVWTEKTVPDPYKIYLTPR